MIGTFTVAAKRVGAFPGDRREMLGVIANQVAISLQNARMYQIVEEQATTDGLTGLVNHREAVWIASAMTDEDVEASEEHDGGSDTERSVVLGLQRSGRIITAAAALLAIVCAAFVSSGVTNIKQLGLGVAFAILLDATVVRGLLVPAFRRLFGAANWWAPRSLRRLHLRYGVWESEPLSILDLAETERSKERH